MVLAGLAGGIAFAQDGFFRGRGRFSPVPAEARVEYDGRFSFVRLRYQGGVRRDPGWAHDYPRADWHFQRILEEITFTRTLRDESNILTLDDPDLGLHPVVYMSEPGFWTLTEAETAGLRAYLQKGGFIIFDDFRGTRDWSNLQGRMADVLPEARWVTLDASHPVFHSFFDIDTLVSEGYYGEAQFLGIFEDNDATKRLLAVANYNHDLGELWEFSDTGWVPVDLSNEAYKYGVNYVIYAMTH
ncbi:MAG: DUF4159 domain-containing protein [Acidobacteria bacterium]|nr:DUF4159 domain-containing protein [Acidobacteriota bacterium]